MSFAGLVVVLTVAEVGGRQPERPDPGLLGLVNRTRALDHHTHALPATLPGDNTQDLLGTSPPFYSVRQRETNPEWIEAWRTLYGYAHRDIAAPHLSEALAGKQRIRRERGVDYPSWVLDQAGIDIAFVNAPSLGSGQTATRFRWVPYGDGFLFPFPIGGFVENVVQRRRTEVGLQATVPSWTDYLSLIASRLDQWKRDGAVAFKFTIAYYRPLDFTDVAEARARTVYERFAQEGTTQFDYRSADYRDLQDFLFRHVVREAGRAGLPVHVHTGEGGGPVFGIAGASPLLLEPILNDLSMAKTTFVLVHGGYPFDRAVTALIQKPNVYVDISGQTFFRSRDDLAGTLRQWLWAFPEKVMFGTDAFGGPPLRGWEEMMWLAARSGREALALALTRMVAAGDITRPHAEAVARQVLHENAFRLYGLSAAPATPR